MEKIRITVRDSSGTVLHQEEVEEGMELMEVMATDFGAWVEAGHKVEMVQVQYLPVPS